MQLKRHITVNLKDSILDLIRINFFNEINTCIHKNGHVVVSRSEVVSITLNNTTVRSFSGGTIVPHYNSSRQLTHFTASISIRDGQTTYYYEITISNR